MSSSSWWDGSSFLDSDDESPLNNANTITNAFLPDYPKDHHDPPVEQHEIMPLRVPANINLLTKFTDSTGNYIKPQLNCLISPNLKVADFKIWISNAWGISQNDIKKGASTGGRVWTGRVDRIDRMIVLRKYKDSDIGDYWSITYIGRILEDTAGHEAKRRRIEIAIPQQSPEPSFEMIEPPSSLSSVTSEKPRHTQFSEVILTPKKEILAVTKYFIAQIKNDCLEQVFIESVNAANCFRPKFRPYMGEKPEHPQSEYVDYSDPATIVTEDNRDLDCISWSYRLALQRYHMYFVEFIDDSVLQKRVMKCSVDDMPNNLNPLTSIDSEAMKEVKKKLQAYDKEKREAFIQKAVTNMEFHLNVGLESKDHSILLL